MWGACVMADKECACGCGEMTKGGTWMSGHDMKHLTRIAKRAGGILVLEGLVDTCGHYLSGEADLDELRAAIAAAFGDCRQE